MTGGGILGYFKSRGVGYAMFGLAAAIVLGYGIAWIVRRRNSPTTEPSTGDKFGGIRIFDIGGNANFVGGAWNITVGPEPVAPPKRFDLTAHQRQDLRSELRALCGDLRTLVAEFDPGDTTGLPDRLKDEARFIAERRKREQAVVNKYRMSFVARITPAYELARAGGYGDHKLEFQYKNAPNWLSVRSVAESICALSERLAD